MVSVRLLSLRATGGADVELGFEASEPRVINPRMYQELERTVSDQARGFEPRTVTHALLSERKAALSMEDLIAITGKAPMEVDRVVAMLEELGWVIHFTEDGFDKYIIRGVVRDDV